MVPEIELLLTFGNNPPLTMKAPIVSCYPLSFLNVLLVIGLRVFYETPGRAIRHRFPIVLANFSSNPPVMQMPSHLDQQLIYIK